MINNFIVKLGDLHWRIERLCLGLQYRWLENDVSSSVHLNLFILFDFYDLQRYA